MSESFSLPALFVAALSVVFLLFPAMYLYMALRERRIFEQIRKR
jgi:hypothetical protein